MKIVQNIVAECFTQHAKRYQKHITYKYNYMTSFHNFQKLSYPVIDVP